MAYQYPSEARKTKVTLTLSPWIVESLDRLAVKFKINSRSELLENVLGEWLRIQARNRLNEETAVYYASMTEKEKIENKAWAQLAAKNIKSFWED